MPHDPDAGLRDRWEDRLARGRRFLEQALASGLCQDVWRSSQGPPPCPGTRNVFLGYFLARALHRTGGIPERSGQLLRRELAAARQGEAYGYSRGAPMDADDTAFALRTRLLLGEPLDRAALGRALAPFTAGAAWRTFAGPNPGAKGWVTTFEEDGSILGPHPEVNRNILSLYREAGVPIRGPLLPEPVLRPSYHYPSRFYDTWMGAGLPRPGREGPDLDAAILALQDPEHGWPGLEGGFSVCQETALALLSLSSEAARGARARAGTAFLAARQDADGGWRGGTLWYFRVPRTGGKILWWAEDAARILATSLALLALGIAVVHSGSKLPSWRARLPATEYE